MVTAALKSTLELIPSNIQSGEEELLILQQLKGGNPAVYEKMKSPSQMPTQAAPDFFKALFKRLLLDREKIKYSVLFLIKCAIDTTEEHYSH